ncbi:MAG: hypothetical protein IH600_00415 [Bacteroidetes bacterium]|nr:hypothetical protein [Bacteroidota bacterium]
MSIAFRFPVILFILAVFALATVSSCSEDDGPLQPTSYGLRITNKTPRDYNVYQRPSREGDVFAKVGVSVSGVMYRVNPLNAGTDYTFRLIRDGNSVDEFDFEKQISSRGGIDVDWEVK